MMESIPFEAFSFSIARFMTHAGNAPGEIEHRKRHLDIHADPALRQMFDLPSGKCFRIQVPASMNKPDQASAFTYRYGFKVFPSLAGLPPLVVWDLQNSPYVSFTKRE